MLQQNQVANVGTARPDVESRFHNTFARTEDRLGSQSRGIVHNSKAEHTDLHGESQQETTSQESFFPQTEDLAEPLAILPTPLVVSRLDKDTPGVGDAVFKREVNMINKVVMPHKVVRQDKVGNEIEQYPRGSDQSLEPNSRDSLHPLTGEAYRLPKVVHKELVKSSLEKPSVTNENCQTAYPQVKDGHLRPMESLLERGVRRPLDSSGLVASEHGAHFGQSSFDFGCGTSSEVHHHKNMIKHPSYATPPIICSDFPHIVPCCSHVERVQPDVMAQTGGIFDRSRMHGKNRLDCTDIGAGHVSCPGSRSSHHVARQIPGSQFACSGSEEGSGGKAVLECRHYLNPRHVFGIPRTVIRVFGSDMSTSDIDLEMQGTGSIDGVSESSISSLDAADVSVSGGDQDSHSTTSGSTSANVDSTEVNQSRVRRNGRQQRGMTTYEKCRLVLVILVAMANIVFLWRMGEWERENGLPDSRFQRTGRRIARFLLV